MKRNCCREFASKESRELAYPEKELEVHLVLHVLIQVLNESFPLVLGQALSDHFQSRHLGRQVPERELPALPPHAHELHPIKPSSSRPRIVPIPNAKAREHKKKKRKTELKTQVTGRRRSSSNGEKTGGEGIGIGEKEVVGGGNTHVRLQAAELDLRELVLEPRIGHQDADVAGHVPMAGAAEEEPYDGYGEGGGGGLRRGGARVRAPIATRARAHDLFSLGD